MPASELDRQAVISYSTNLTNGRSLCLSLAAVHNAQVR